MEEKSKLKKEMYILGKENVIFSVKWKSSALFFEDR